MFIYELQALNMLNQRVKIFEYAKENSANKITFQ